MFVRFPDERDFFAELYKRRDFLSNGIPFKFFQVNLSHSKKGVKRKHYQLKPMEQGKLVYVVSGKVYDVVVDIRKGSPWFGRSVGVTLRQGYAFWVPLGFIHGFQALEDAYFLYLVTKEYLQQHERCISWSGPEVGIDRPIKESMVIGEKDRKSHRSGKLRRTSNIANKTTMETNLLMAFCISNKACHPLR